MSLSSWGGTPSRPRTRIIYKRFDAFLTMSSMWDPHFRSFCRVSPTTLCEVTMSKWWLSILKDGKGGRWRKKQILISLHFLIFRSIQLMVAQLWMVFRSCWRVLSACLSRVPLIDTSSTYFQVDVSAEAHWRSLIIIENRIGLSLVPCGTPAVIGCHSEKTLLNLTRCLRSVRKLIIYGIRHLLTPIRISFPIRALYPIRIASFRKV